MSDLIAITCAQCDSTTSKHKLAWIRVDQGGQSAAFCTWECALRFVRKLRLTESLLNDGYTSSPWELPDEWMRMLSAGDYDEARGGAAPNEVVSLD